MITNVNIDVNIAEVLFIVFAVAAIGFHIYSLFDAYQNVHATEYARRYLPHLYRPEQKAAARNSVRNEWYRLATQAVIVSVAAIMVFTSMPRPPEIVVLLTVLATVVAFILFAGALHEHIDRRRFMTYFQKGQREAEKNDS